MKRSIIQIDQEKCNGCGLCVDACAEGAIQLIDGKAKLVSEVYCDGLGACIGHCPQDAITIEQRQADEFDAAAVEEHLSERKKISEQLNFVCPGMMAKKLRDNSPGEDTQSVDVPSQLGHWPVQLKLVPSNAPYLAGADLLLVADCVPFAMGDFHNRFLKNHSVVVGCPKLDDVDFYIEKLALILKQNEIKSLTVVHMEVPCCSALRRIAEQAISTSTLQLPFDDVTISLNGGVKSTEKVNP